MEIVCREIYESCLWYDLQSLLVKARITIIIKTVAIKQFGILPDQYYLKSDG